MSDSKMLPVRKWVVNLQEVVDDDLAREGWLALIRAQGWSPVGDPEVARQPEFGEYAVYGRIVEYPGLTVASDAASIVVPA